jgi:glycosyltransferase involved in cell wall biosynthesis
LDRFKKDAMSSLKLSILMPVYNEIATIEQVIKLVQCALPGIEKELVIVDDGSRDGTREWLRKTFSPVVEERELLGSEALAVPIARASPKDCAVLVILHETNKGKGGAIQTGMKACTGELLVIQDADLEYDPSDWHTMYDLIAIRKIADVVYGSRFYGKPHRSLYYHHYIGNRLISIIYNVLFNQMLTDIEVCYKMINRAVLQSLTVTCNDFGFEIQISAQIARARRRRIYETPIRYYGRTYAEGKKINWTDGFKALYYLIKYRFVT